MVDVAQLPHLLHICDVQRTHAGLALNEFEDDRGHRTLAVLAESGGRERLIHRDGVACTHEFDVRHQRLERLADHGLPRGGQSAHGTSVESVGERQDARRLAADARARARQRATVQLGELQRSLIAFGTGVAEVDVGAFRGPGERNQSRREPDLRLGREIVAHVGAFRGLLGHRLHPCGVRVAQRIDGDAREEVKVFVAVHVPYAHAFAVVHHAQRRAEHVHVDLAVLSQPLRVGGAERFLSRHRNSSFRCHHRAQPWCRCRRW